MGIFFWFSLTLVLLVFEASTLGLVCIWFAAGALVTAIVSLYMDIIWLQWLIFALVSGLSLILVRPLIADKLNSKLEKTNIESIIGAKGKVEKKIDNFNGAGEVTVKGQTWTALSVSDDKVIEKGALVKVKEIQGVKLIVEEVKED